VAAVGDVPLVREKKLRILAITAAYPPHHTGGYEIRSKDIIDCLRARGHQVLVVASNLGRTRGKSPDDVCRVLHLEPSRNLAQRIAWDMYDLRYINRLMRRWQPDVVHLFHTVQLTRTLLPYLAQLGATVVYDEGTRGLLIAWERRGRWFSLCERRSGSRLRHLLRRTLIHSSCMLSRNLLPTEWCLPADMIVYFNNEHTLKLTQRAGVPIRHARVIHSGLKLDEFPFRRGRTGKQDVRFLFPGRVTKEKNVEDAIRALGNLKARQPEGFFSLDVVGPVQDPAYQEELLRVALESGVRGSIRFLPMVPHDRMSEVYRQADFCFLLSHVEGLSRVTLEAMASGSVLVTTGAGGGQEVVRHGANGIIVTAGAPERIADAVAGLLETEADYLRIQENARRHVEENHDFGPYVDSIEAVLLEAVSGGRRDRR
jgi:glycogen synthase